MGNEYYLGLDMGTGSLGWAVTNDKYEILRAHGKALWGVRLFENAKTAEERRMFRTARRRRQRELWRIQVLQELFAEEISKVDEGFYLRMKESRYVKEDKRDVNGKCPELPYALFVDHDYTDKDYHKEFPTIYHLRKMLMNTGDMPDIRLVYLALHHFMKHRGHFLFSGDIQTIKEFKNVFSQFIQCLYDEELDFHIQMDDSAVNQVEEILKDKKLTKSAKKQNLIKISGATTKCEKALFNLIVGGKAKLSDIFGDEELNQTEHPSIAFTESTYEDYIGGVESELAERFIVIENAKAIYDWSILVDILGTHTSLSEAKIEIYEKHKKDLALFKKFVKKYLPEEDYKEIFVCPEDKFNNYPAYIGSTKVNGEKRPLEGKRCSREDFYKFIRGKISSQNLDAEGLKLRQYIEEEMDKETFLPKQVDKGNGVLPYQVHLYELRKILDNLKNKSSFIMENCEKIEQLFLFKIPYYVGPLNVIKDQNDPKFTWAVRKTDDRIYPWNFDEVIDTDASAEKFIRRMTNKCTYLYGEDVLPKDSLLYSKFTVLNELNNVRINGEKMSVPLKQQVYQDVFQNYRKVTVSKLKKYLKKEGVVEEPIDITGIDGDFKSGLTAFHDFKEKLTGVDFSENEKEQIILNIVLFGEDKKLLKNRLKRMFPNLTEGRMKGICSLNYKGWGRLSRKFLEEVTAPAPETGEAWSIIQALWETQDNLMQLLSEKYLFREDLEDKNRTDKKIELNYGTVEELYVSPAVKRQIWQTLKVVKEIQKVMHGQPKRIFVEVAKEKMPSKRTESRKNHLLDLYKNCRDEERNWTEEISSFSENQLRGDKLYLYYTQMGQCMYSGEKIELEDLWDNNKYDIDHIYPQSKVMDDSLDNRVLVKKEYNAKKLDVYPISSEIRSQRAGFWKMLLDKKYISKEKYKRLVRSNGFEVDELEGFIARQLVENRQSTKITAEILKQAFPESEIVYAKAKNVSKFRQDFGLLKVREMNDLHHAKDAYLNIVVGNAYYVKFTKNAAWYLKNDKNRSYNLNKMFISEYDIKRGNETAWVAGEKGTVSTVRNVMRKNNILVTRQTFEVKGGLFDQQLMKKGKGQIPIKGHDERLASVDKYGGYNKATGSYFMLVESEDRKGQKIRSIVEVPLYLEHCLRDDEKCMTKYLIENKKLIQPRVLIPCIKKDALFKINGFPMRISGRTGKQLIFKGAAQLILSPGGEKTLKEIIKYVQRRKDNKDSLISERVFRKDELAELYDELTDKLEHSIFEKRPNNQLQTLKEHREEFLKLTKENQSLVLYEVLHLFQCDNVASDLKLISGPGHAGIILLNNNITNLEQILLIHQSTTGIYEQVIDLKTV